MPPASEALDELQGQIDAWVARQMDDYIAGIAARPKTSDAKIVRDAVHGYQTISPWEVDILDSPVVQRLHSIHQTGLSYLVYPSANHTRFEHSLGVCYMVTELARSGRDRGLDQLFTQKDIEELRLAAILHDTGHSLLSHLSEVILESTFPVFGKIRQETDFKRSKAGELLSYAIVRSAPMQRLLNICKERHNRNWNLERIAGMIVGVSTDSTSSTGYEQYLADMVNGPFDADKMDYLLRDSHLTGIKGDVDVARLLYAFTVHNAADGIRRMAMSAPGVPILEQILFSKMQLYTAMYHHHKVRAVECMIKGLFEIIYANKDRLANPLLRFDSISDFLNIDDLRFFGAALEERLLRDRIERILRRDLLKRALLISRHTLVNAEGDSVLRPRRDKLRRLVGHGDRPSRRLTALRQLIFDRIPAEHQTELSDLWVDLPTGPHLSEEAVLCIVVFAQGTEDVTNLYKLFPLDRWLESYEQNKWAGHVFYVGGTRERQAANRAAREVLTEHFQLEFQPRATTACKLPI